MGCLPWRESGANGHCAKSAASKGGNVDGIPDIGWLMLAERPVDDMTADSPRHSARGGWHSRGSP